MEIATLREEDLGTHEVVLVVAQHHTANHTHKIVLQGAQAVLAARGYQVGYAASREEGRGGELAFCVMLEPEATLWPSGMPATLRLRIAPYTHERRFNAKLVLEGLEEAFERRGVTVRRVENRLDGAGTPCALRVRLARRRSYTPATPAPASMGRSSPRTVVPVPSQREPAPPGPPAPEAESILPAHLASLKEVCRDIPDTVNTTTAFREYLYAGLPAERRAALERVILREAVRSASDELWSEILNALPQELRDRIVLTGAQKSDRIDREYGLHLVPTVDSIMALVDEFNRTMPGQGHILVRSVAKTAIGVMGALLKVEE